MPRVLYWGPPCSASEAIVAIRIMYGDIPWWNLEKRRQRRAAILAVRRIARDQRAAEDEERDG